MKYFSFWLLLLYASHALAFQWQDLWQTPDEQAQKLMAQHQYLKAEARFENPDWKATAAYRAQQYERAAHAFQAAKTADGFYNQGNALAHLQQYEAAIGAYDAALKLNPKHKDAAYNREIVKKLLQQKQQEKSNQDKKENKDKNKDKDKSQNKSDKDQSSQNKNKQDQDMQNQSKPENSQQKKDKENKNPEPKKGQKKQNQPKSKAEKEKQHANEQWLKLIPDDPGGLLREKFLRDHLRRQDGESL